MVSESDESEEFSQLLLECCADDWEDGQDRATLAETLSPGGRAWAAMDSRIRANGVTAARVVNPAKLVPAKAGSGNPRAVARTPRTSRVQVEPKRQMIPGRQVRLLRVHVTHRARQSRQDRIRLREIGRYAVSRDGVRRVRLPLLAHPQAHALPTAHDPGHRLRQSPRLEVRQALGA